jgi:hypothetical protein
VCNNKLYVSKLHSQAKDFNLIHFLLGSLTVLYNVSNTMHVTRYRDGHLHGNRSRVSVSWIQKLTTEAKKTLVRITWVTFQQQSHFQFLGSRTSHSPPHSQANLMGVEWDGTNQTSEPLECQRTVFCDPLHGTVCVIDGSFRTSS